jgi:hypothetical protein
MEPSKVAIYEGDDNVIDNPTIRLSDVFFHSDLNYMRVNKIIETTVTLPAISAGTTASSNVIWFGNHTVQTSPIALGYVKNLSAPLSGSLILDMNYNPARFRQVDIVTNTSQVGLIHTGLVHSSAAAYGQMSLQIICAVFEAV